MAWVTPYLTTEVLRCVLQHMIPLDAEIGVDGSPYAPSTHHQSASTMFDMDMGAQNHSSEDVHVMAHKLDSMMMALFEFIRRVSLNSLAAEELPEHSHQCPIDPSLLPCTLDFSRPEVLQSH